jgi:hypothetical protein
VVKPKERSHLTTAQSSPLDQLIFTLKLVGLRLPETLADAANLIALPAALTLTLFAGPLYTSYLDSGLPGMRNFDFRRDVWDVVRTWQGFRNYLAVRDLPSNPTTHPRPVCDRLPSRRNTSSAPASSPQVP